MLSSRLNNQLKPSLILVIDENPSNSSLGFQFTCAYACETVNKFSKTDILLTEHDENWFQSHVFSNRDELKFKINIIDIFNDAYSTKTIEECIKITDEKNLIIIESLPWLLLRMNEGNLSRLLHKWSKSNIIMGIVPVDCLEDPSILKNLISISYITVRIKNLLKSETIEAKIEQRSRTNVDSIKSTLTFSIDKQLNPINLHEEKISNRKLKSSSNKDNSSNITANLTFNLHLKDDELTAKNNLVLPYTKQHLQVSDDGCTIHYSYDKEDDIDEDEDEDLNL